MTFPLIDTKHTLHKALHTASTNSPLSWPRMRLYMLRSPNTFRKYHDAELTLCHTTRWRKASYRYCKILTPINISKTASQNFNVVNSRPNRSQAALYMWPTQIYLENINSAHRYTCLIFVCFRYFYLPSLLWQSIQPVKNSVTKCWRGYLSGARCRLFAYCPADATASYNTTVSCPI